MYQIFNGVPEEDDFRERFDDNESMIKEDAIQEACFRRASFF